MDTYLTGATIKRLREQQGLTQAALAAQVGVSDKAISKWETGKGLPDIALLEPLAAALAVSVTELLSGNTVTNKNTSCNMLRAKFYVCPVCGNVVHAAGDAAISCCGISLMPLEAEPVDDAHAFTIDEVEDEHFLTVHHDMTKTHFISFAAFVTSDRVQFVKFYPEGNAETRFQRRGSGILYLYCNRHGLMKRKV